MFWNIEIWIFYMDIMKSWNRCPGIIIWGFLRSDLVLYFEAILLCTRCLPGFKKRTRKPCWGLHWPFQGVQVVRRETMDGQQIGSVHNFEATGVLRVPVSALRVSPRGSAWLCVAHLGRKKVLSLLPLPLQLNCTIIVLSSAILTLNTLATLSTHIAYGQWPYCVDFSTIVRLQKALPEYEGKTGIKLISCKISSFSKWEQQHTRGLLMFSTLLYVKLVMIGSIHLVKTHILICQNPHLDS